MNSEKNGTVCWYSNASPNRVRTPHLSASANTSVSNRLLPMPGGPSMTSTPPRPRATAATNSPITFSSSARPRIGGVTSRWPPTSERPVEDPIGCPVYRLLDRHCSPGHCRRSSQCTFAMTDLPKSELDQLQTTGGYLVAGATALPKGVGDQVQAVGQGGQLTTLPRRDENNQACLTVQRLAGLSQVREFGGGRGSTARELRRSHRPRVDTVDRLGQWGGCPP